MSPQDSKEMRVVEDRHILCEVSLEHGSINVIIVLFHDSLDVGALREATREKDCLSCCSRDCA